MAKTSPIGWSSGHVNGRGRGTIACHTRPCSWRFPPGCGARRRWLWIGLLAIGLAIGASHTCFAQGVRRTRPRLTYYAAIGELFDGDYRRAQRDFQAEVRGGIKSVQSLWIDSICSYTMLGESYYYAGNYPQALEQYNAALQLYLAYSDWMLLVQFPPVIQRATAQASGITPWGRSTRGVVPGKFPNSMLIHQGRVDQSEVIQYGGTIQPATLYPLNVHEIVRCTALALRRRRELLGPLSAHDPLTDDLVAALSRRPGVPNHWSEVWIDAQLGLAYAAAGDAAQAQKYLVRSLVAGGTYDHPLTGTALLVLGQLALEAGDLNAAAKFFAEASYSGYAFGDLGIIEESLRYGQRVHLMAGANGIYPPLAGATAWARTKRLRQLQAWLALLTTENYVAIRNPQQADLALAAARSLIGSRSMANGLIGGQLKYLSARVEFQLNRPETGFLALNAALEFAQIGSKWMFQIGLADQWYLDGLSPRVAMSLYNELLRDPEPADWSFDPFESLSVLALPHRSVFEHWFGAALKRKEIEKAVEIADRARRHTFLSSRTMGGRLLALRWILETPPAELHQRAALQRQDLLVRFPEYDQLAQQAKAARNRLAAPPLVSDQVSDERQTLWAQLTQISHAQEALLRDMALGRFPTDLSFPPIRATKDLMYNLQKGQALLVTFVASGQLYGFLFTNQQYRPWRIGSPVALRRGTVDLLRQLGNYDANHELNLTAITDQKWKRTARNVLGLFLKDSRLDLTQNIEELIIVPDGFLWYLPFEALVAGPPQEGRPLLAQMRIRYAPTASLALPERPRAAAVAPTGVVLGKLYARDADPAGERTVEGLAKVLPDAVTLQSPLPAPSPVVASLLGGLIALSDIDGRDPYGWAPIGLDRPPAIGSLQHWFTLPWGGPRNIILPGYHTAAENGLKGRRNAATGNDMFLSVCGLMACGGRTLLLSRWRTGGQISLDLVREFVQELPHTRAADAWQRSVQLCRLRPIDAELEPRIKRLDVETSPPAEHPFFWSGYMLVDTGAGPPDTDPPDPKEDQKPILKFKPPAAQKPVLKSKPPAEGDKKDQ